MRFAIFQLHLSNSTAPARKKWCQVIRSAAPVTQHHLPKTEDLMLQNASPPRKSAPGPPNISDEHVSCTAPATENASLQILFKCPTPAIVFRNAVKPSRSAHFWQGAQPLAPATRNGIWTSKSALSLSMFFTRLTSKCASHHNSVHFFDISTSRSALNSSVFNTFDFEMCFAPQRRALFRHLNFQKWSEHGVLWTFWLGNVLRATTACTFSTSQLPNALRHWGALCILASKVFQICFAPQRRAFFPHLNFQKWSDAGVLWTCWLGNVLRATTACNFSSLIWPAGSAPAALASLLFDPPEPQIIGKTVLRVFPTFSRTCIFFLLTVSLLSASSPSLLFIGSYCRKFDF